MKKIQAGRRPSRRRMVMGFLTILALGLTTPAFGDEVSGDLFDCQRLIQENQRRFEQEVATVQLRINYREEQLQDLKEQLADAKRWDEKADIHSRFVEANAFYIGDLKEKNNLCRDISARQAAAFEDLHLQLRAASEDRLSPEEIARFKGTTQLVARNSAMVFNQLYRHKDNIQDPYVRQQLDMAERSARAVEELVTRIVETPCTGTREIASKVALIADAFIHMHSMTTAMDEMLSQEAFFTEVAARVASAEITIGQITGDADITEMPERFIEECQGNIEQLQTNREVLFEGLSPDKKRTRKSSRWD